MYDVLIIWKDAKTLKTNVSKSFITHFQVEVEEDLNFTVDGLDHQKQVVYRQTIGFLFIAHLTARGVNRALKGISTTLRNVTLAREKDSRRNALVKNRRGQNTIG